MLRQCRISGVEFEISALDQALYAKLGPLVAGRHYPMKLPECCYDERMRQKLVFRNQSHFFRATSCISGKPLVSIYSPSRGFNVCSRSEFLEFDNTALGREFDFSRPFFDQFRELQQDTIKAGVLQSGEILNTEYGDFIGWCKDCYFVFDAGKLQDTLYSQFTGFGRDIVDSYIASYCELIYGCTLVHHCYSLFHSQRCRECSFSAYLNDCIGCTQCLGCMNLRHKSYQIFNEPVSKVAFEERRAKLFSGSYSEQQRFAEEYQAFQRSMPHRALHVLNCSDATGDDLTNCESVHYCFNCEQLKNCAYLSDAFFKVEDCIDVHGLGDDCYSCGDLVGCFGDRGQVNITNCYYSAYVFYGGNEVLYSQRCLEKCSNLFGCADLRRKQYCVLNKQYTREEYEQLLPRIIEHMQTTAEWGEFFPMSLSTFAYNKSQAMEEYPLSREEALCRGALWDEYESPVPEVKAVIAAANLPDRLDQVDDAILNAAILCAVSAKPFRLTQKELAFYRAQHLPLPRLCFYERHLARKKLINPRRLWSRTCARSGKPMLSSYAPERPEVVISEEEFMKEFL